MARKGNDRRDGQRLERHRLSTGADGSGVADKQFLGTILTIVYDRVAIRDDQQQVAV